MNLLGVLCYIRISTVAVAIEGRSLQFARRPLKDALRHLSR